MTQAKHTPGPWIASGQKVHSLQYHEPLSSVNEVAKVPNTNPESMANASLIAAAPKLLEMLDDAIAFIAQASDDGILNADECAPLLANYRAVIAKATGGAA